MLRSILFFVLFALATAVLSIGLILFGWSKPDLWCGRIGGLWARITLRLLRGICGLDYQVKGLEHLPSSSFIVLAKHQSAWETIALRTILPPSQAWILKYELQRIPLFGSALKLCRPIAIDRKAGRKAIHRIIEQGTQALQEGRNVIVFPEGTRVAPTERKRYGIGGALLGERSGYPIVPLAHNAGVFWKRRGLRKFPGTVSVVIGPVVETKGRKAPEINREVEQWIEATMEKLVPTEGSERDRNPTSA